MARGCVLWQGRLALAAITLIVAGCTHVPTVNGSLSLEVADRIAVVGQGQAWYAALKLVDSRPDVVWNGPPSYYVTVWLAAGVDPGGSATARACEAILDAVTNPQYGRPFSINSVDLEGDTNSHECWVPGAVDSPVPPT